MVISRKPVPSTSPAPVAATAELDHPAAPMRQDSWEIYSDDDDDDRSHTLNSASQPGEGSYTPYKAEGGEQQAPAQYQGPSPDKAPRQADAADELKHIPVVLRPGGARAQTNPFVRAENPSLPPTAQLSKLNVEGAYGTGWGPQQQQQQQQVQSQSASSSNYDTPPTTVTSDNNPWLGDPASHTYSPVAESALFPTNPRETILEPTTLRSPLQTENDIWSSSLRSTPPQAPAQAPPPPPQLENNPWASATSTPPKQPTPTPNPPNPPNPPTSSLARLGAQDQVAYQAHRASNPPPGESNLPTIAPLNPLTPHGATPGNQSSPTPPPQEHLPSPPPPSRPAPPAAPPVPPPPQPPAFTYRDSNPFNPRNTAVARPTASQSHSPALMSVPSDDDSTWVDASQDVGDKSSHPAQATGILSGANSNTDAWEGLDVFDRAEKGKAKAVGSQIGEWKLVDVGEPSSIASGTAGDTPGEEAQPPLPSRDTAAGALQWTSTRPPVDAKTETYQVKNIKWHDANSAENPRVSPILIQNANGPCPLVALVNALSLTTPPEANDTSLVEVLRSREQVSLNLLLDAVFEELMSPRRTDADAALPDVGDLYAFLMSLHTGMNVNPRFIPSASMRYAFEHTSLTHLPVPERGNFIPGTFENTHEMGLYATFKIPLIHGWLPSANDPVCDALERQAQSYEDAQNLLFREEELEHKLSTDEGLTEDEQQLYQDIVTIRSFLESSATQLTSWGIQVICKSIRPGTFAILFRNDHFSTLYCHPQTKELVTLVTDDGYRTNNDVVWESLVDINGQRTQYLSGDFKVVGSGASTTVGGYSDERGAGEWTTVQNRRGKARQEPTEEAPLSASEQEDRDLALALQLQEEEDQRHREEETRRQREQNLSSQFIEQQGRQAYGSVSSGSRASVSNSIAPARRSSNSVNVAGAAGSPRLPPRRPSQQVRPLVPPRRQNAPGPNTNRPGPGGADAPPSYEQAAHDQPFVPPVGHPNHPASTSDAGRTPTSASGPQTGFPPRQAQRPPGQMATGRPAVGGRERDRDCVVM